MSHRPTQSILPGIRLALALGYGGLLGLLVFLGLYAARSLGYVKRAEAHSSRTYIARSDRLEAVLSKGYAASGVVRDYLLDPDAESIERHRKTAYQKWAETLEALQEYKHFAARARADAIRMLEDDMDRYWAVAGQSLELRGQRRIRMGYEVLTGQLVPLRDRWLAMLNELRILDRRDLHSNISNAAMELEGLERRLWIVLCVSVLLGIFLAAGAWRYLLQLEKTAQEQYNASVEFADRLEELSQRVLNVQEDERRRLARELHDEVGQVLGALLVDLGQAEGALSSSFEKVRKRLRSAHRLAETALNTVRNMTLLLRPSMLDDLGLIPALYWQARETSRRTGMDVRVTAEQEDLDLPDPLRTTIYRVVQEALQNAARHSRAGSVEIVIQLGDGGLRILIRDDGQGFDPKTTKGIGLLGMQERVSQLGGEMLVESAPGHGTLLKVQLPLESVEDAARKSA